MDNKFITNEQENFVSCKVVLGCEIKHIEYFLLKTIRKSLRFFLLKKVHSMKSSEIDNEFYTFLLVGYNKKSAKRLKRKSISFDINLL